jgi:hypothetical protein
MALAIDDEKHLALVLEELGGRHLAVEIELGSRDRRAVETNPRRESIPLGVGIEVHQDREDPLGRRIDVDLAADRLHRPTVSARRESGE